MSIRRRITLLIALSIIAIFTVSGYSIFQARVNAAEVKKVTEGVVPSALATADLVSQVKEVQLVTMALVSAPNGNLAGQASDKLVIGKKILQEEINFQIVHVADNTQKGLVEQANDNLLEYFSAIDDTVKFKLAGQNEIADATYYGSVVVLQRELQQIVETLRVEKSREKDAAIAVLNDNLSKTAAGVTGLSLVIMVGLSLFGFFLYRQIITPISQMQETTSEIATSQDFTRRVPVRRMDEIGKSIVAFNLMITKIEESSALLKQKTNDINSMLQNMPQGILTITAGNKVHSEYSAYLEKILDTEDIVDHNFMDLVFSNTNLGSDALSQIDAVISACINEDEINFHLNSHLLAAEIEKSMQNGQIKILDLSWSPITDSAGTIVRLMLCVRDVTELRLLAAEANKQKRELEIIGEILSVTQDKFYMFITSSLNFIDENELLIRDNSEHNSDVLMQLFRNMHTIKGNARTYGLNHLTSIVHEVEQDYVELREVRLDLIWNQIALMDSLLKVRETVEYYAKINEVSLGRKGTGRREGVEHFLMVDKQQILATINLLENATPGNLNELRAAHAAASKTLRLLGTERIIETLEGVFDSLPALANELGKLPPIVEIQDNGYVVHNQASGMLKNVFMHLLRNSMDHGLETPEERWAQNKPVAGTITLTMDVQDGMLQINLSDDGRGIALARIRNIAIENKLVTSEEKFTDEEIADLIFRSSFSTATTVTEVSGRGVGMDAVRNFVNREHGKINIRFTDTNIGAEYRQFEVIVSLPEMLSEYVGEFDFHRPNELEDGLIDIQSVDKTIAKQA
jgi:two-component system chemotaxis sensor kinase CheA